MFIEQVKVFNRRGYTQDEVTVAGEKAIMCLYKPSTNISDLNQLRHQQFLELMRTSKKAIEAKNLPPISAAIMFQSMRVYYQVQTWKNIELDAEEWGWKIMDESMVPQQTGLDVAPKELLEFVRCHCKTGCSTKHCSCKKIGLPCLTACGKCKGICENMGEGDIGNVETDDMEIGLEVENWDNG